MLRAIRDDVAELHDYRSKKERKQLHRSLKRVHKSLRRIFGTSVTVEQLAENRYYIPALDLTVHFVGYPNVFETYGLYVVDGPYPGDEIVHLTRPADFEPFVRPELWSQLDENRDSVRFQS